MATGRNSELGVGDEQPPIYRSGSYRSVAGQVAGERSSTSLSGYKTCLKAVLSFALSHRLNFIVTLNIMVLSASLSTLSLVATVGAPSTPFACSSGVGSGWGQSGNLTNAVCNATGPETAILSVPCPSIDPEDFDAVALHELSRRDLFRTIKTAVRDALLKSKANETSIFRLIFEDLLTAGLYRTTPFPTLDNPEYGK